MLVCTYFTNTFLCQVLQIQLWTKQARYLIVQNLSSSVGVGKRDNKYIFNSGIAIKIKHEDRIEWWRLGGRHLWRGDVWVETWMMTKSQSVTWPRKARAEAQRLQWSWSVLRTDGKLVWIENSQREDGWHKMGEVGEAGPGQTWGFGGPVKDSMPSSIRSHWGIFSRGMMGYNLYFKKTISLSLSCCLS